MAEAMRSMAEWAASLNMPSEPVRMPVSNLSSATMPAAMTEKIAAERLAACGVGGVRLAAASCMRSEEHTSELQSLRHLVCRLLLEEKDTEQRQRSYAGVAADELAHQWFGYLLTLAWWVDFFFNDTATTEISPLSLPDALPI